MKNSIVIIFCLMLTVLWAQAFTFIRYDFSGVDEYRQLAKSYQSQLERQQLKTILVENQLREFRQHVASVLPKAIPSDKASYYPMRNLASVVRERSNDRVKLSMAKTLFERGKTHFRLQEYSAANVLFRKIIDFYSYSEHIIEAHFLLAEGLYQQRAFEEATEIVQQMIEQYPESELTGYAMLRLGRIFESQRRASEAFEIYKTVLRTYPQRDVASQATQAMRDVEP